MHGGARRHTIPVAVAVSVLAALGLRAPGARGQTPAAVLPLQLEYSAPGNCPTQADFEAGVRSHTALARFADETDAQPVRVVVKPMGVTYAGHLTIVGRSGHQSERDVEDTACADVVDALALVTALAVDPNATLRPGAPPAASPPAVAPTAPEVPGGDLVPVPVPVVPLLAPVPAPPPPAPPAPRPAKRAPDSATSLWPPAGWHVNVGASFVTSAGLAPDALAGGGAFGELEARSASWLAPSGRLTLDAAANGAFKQRTASFLFVGGRLDVCPVRLGSSELSLRPCVAADIGAVRAEALVPSPGVRNPVPGTTGWSDAAALLRARWAPGGGRWFVEVEGGGFLPAYHPDFVLHPNRVVYTSKGGPLGSATVGVRL